MNFFEKAWERRGALLDELGSLRVFHGPGEGSGALSRIAIDRFLGENGDAHFWVTEWADRPLSEAHVSEIRGFLKSRGAVSAVALLRPEKDLPSEPVVLLGSPPETGFIARERELRFRIRLLGVKHPGLFLDHYPLRAWLMEKASGLRVLNTFAYTGSLSVAAGKGGASHVTTLDLSKPTIEWAKENWSLNTLAAESARFIFGDYFEWIPRLKKEGKVFDCILLDPPSFSRGKSGTFSTAKDLERLHRLAFEVLAPGGILATSINSANVRIEKFEKDVRAAAGKRKLEVLKEIELPETFPAQRDDDRYLKGWILRIS